MLNNFKINCEIIFQENNKEINHVSPTKSDTRELLATSDSTNVEDELHKAMEEVVSAYERFHKLLTGKRYYFQLLILIG